MSDLFNRFGKLKRLLSRKKIIKKKDLLKLKSKDMKEYFTFRAFLKVDGRLRPESVRREFKKFKNTAIKFKSEDIGLNLKKTGYFDKNDKYKSSKKAVAVVTDAIQKHGSQITSLKEKTELVDIRYKQTALRKVIYVGIDDLEFLEELPENYYINIEGTSYNKNGLDFVFDYFNQSNDYTQNLSEKVDRQLIRIYKR